MNPPKPADALRRIRRELTDLLGQLGTLEVSDAVTIGWELWHIIGAGHRAIEPIKQVMRARAEADGRRGPILYRGDDGTTCQVVVPDPQPKLRQDADLDALRKALGDKYGDLFSENLQVQPRPKFESLVKDLTPEERDAVLHAVDLAPGTSRVSFE